MLCCILLDDVLTWALGKFGRTRRRGSGDTASRRRASLAGPS